MLYKTGRVLGPGRRRERINPFTEVYSGSNADDTPEEVGYSGPESDQWSVMSKGWNGLVNNHPMDGDYIAFSIQELYTIELRIGAIVSR